MECPKCQGENNIVIKTEKLTDRVERIRKCLKCGHPWITVEIERHEYVKGEGHYDD